MSDERIKTDVERVDEVIDSVEGLIKFLCPKYKKLIKRDQSICIPPNCLLGDKREVRGMNCRLCSVKHLLYEVKILVTNNGE